MAPGGEGAGPLGFLAQPGGDAAQSPGKARRQMDLYNGAITVAGPPGYCVDDQSLLRSRKGRFLLIGSCSALSGGDGLEVDPAVITVAVLPPSPGTVQPSADEIARTLPEGTARQSINGDGISLVGFNAGGDRVVPGVDPKHWRAVMVVNGYTLGLASYAPKGSDMAGEAGRRLLIDTAEMIREHNPPRAASGVAAASASTAEAQALPPVLDTLFGWTKKRAN